MRASRYVAGFDSAGAMLRALARFLHGRDFPALGNPRVLAPLLVAGNLLPARLRERLYAASGGLTAVPAERLGRPFVEEVAAWMTSRYPRRRFPLALIGSSNGAAVHLAAALGAPWLPQTFMVPVRNPGNDPDDPRRDLEWGRQPARALLEANPEVQVHHMHDPVQDRLMLEQMTYFRLKRLRLGPAYERFLREVLEPGGTLLLVDCRHTWPVTQVGDRHLFQFGAVGGATQEELFGGSDRVAAYLARYRTGLRRWDPPAPDGEAPEAEWGFEEALAADVERFAGEHGYQVARLGFDAPPDLSPLVADLYRWWYAERGLPDDRLLVESFILLEPWWTLAAGLVPLWTTFNTEDAAAPVERYLDQRPPFAEIHLTLFAHGVESVGLAPIQRWRAILGRASREGRFAGVDPRAYPRDFASFVRYHHALKRIGQRAPLPEPLPWASVEAFLQRTASQVRLTPSSPPRNQADRTSP
ncbi:MAG: hypothetical protein ACJ782_00230 [Actinomycetota bacterium]